MARQFDEKKGFSKKDMAANFAAIAEDFAAVPVTYTPKVKVGVVGEIYVKYSPLGNNDLEQFLHGEDCDCLLYTSLRMFFCAKGRSSVESE